MTKKKEQEQGKYIIYFINFGTTILEKLGTLPNKTHRLA